MNRLHYPNCPNCQKPFTAAEYIEQFCLECGDVRSKTVEKKQGRAA